MTTQSIETMIGWPVAVEYRTINLGNGTPEEQESGVIEGRYNGNRDNSGRNTRYHLDAADGDRCYLFADEIQGVRANWTQLGRELRASALDAHEGVLPSVETAYSFLLDNPECFIGDDAEWPSDMPAEPNIELIAAYWARS